MPLSKIDGIERTAADEKKLNEALAICFASPAGETALKYLRDITVDRVAGPGIDQNSLLHMEGSRYLFSIIRNRVNNGRNKK